MATLPLTLSLLANFGYFLVVLRVHDVSIVDQVSNGLYFYKYPFSGYLGQQVFSHSFPSGRPVLHQKEGMSEHRAPGCPCIIEFPADILDNV